MNEKKQIVSFRPITESDVEFLYNVYVSTRAEEMKLTGWTEKEVEEFLRMQFNLQHGQYMKNYREGGTFEIIVVDNIPAGRLYVHRKKNSIHIVDIALLTGFRRKGTGSEIMKNLMDEADQKNFPLSLYVEQNNPAMNLYESLGFEKKDLTGIYYFMERPPVSKKMEL